MIGTEESKEGFEYGHLNEKGEYIINEKESHKLMKRFDGLRVKR
jgi:hypothetical protein